MKKRKKFRRVKVGNRGYIAGKRQAMFRAHEKKTAMNYHRTANTKQ